MLWLDCQTGMGGQVWPDGRAPLDQPVKLAQAFRRIGAEMAYWARETK